MGYKVELWIDPGLNLHDMPAQIWQGSKSTMINLNILRNLTPFQNILIFFLKHIVFGEALQVKSFKHFDYISLHI